MCYCIFAIIAVLLYRMTKFLIDIRQIMLLINSTLYILLTKQYRTLSLWFMRMDMLRTFRLHTPVSHVRFRFGVYLSPRVIDSFGRFAWGWAK